MSDIEKGRIQRDAQRTVAGRRPTSSHPEQAVVRHLGVELYKERRRSERKPEEPGDQEDTSPES